MQRESRSSLINAYVRFSLPLRMKSALAFQFVLQIKLSHLSALRSECFRIEFHFTARGIIFGKVMMCTVLS